MKIKVTFTHSQPRGPFGWVVVLKCRWFVYIFPVLANLVILNVFLTLFPFPLFF